jgi:hypothetical protein
MYQLTIDTPHAVSVTDHPDRDDAHGQLMRRVVAGDYYLRTIQAGRAHTTYELLTVDDHRRRPHSTGHAIIEELTGERALPVDTPELAAAAARRWIAHHQPTWDHGSDSDPGTGYPLAILTAARAEARCWFTAGLLLPEAASLADVAPIPRPSQRLLEALRHNATADPAHHAHDLADVVGTQLENRTDAATLATLIWWYALLSWGASAT